MKHQYRLVKVSNSDGPDKTPRHEGNEEGNERPVVHKHVWIGEPQKRGTVPWIIAICAIVLTILGVVWMSHVANSLHHISQQEAANSKAIQHQATQLSAIQNALDGIKSQLLHLENEIQNIYMTIFNR